jgi:DNA-binding MarR family transcriptional regulator
VARLERDGLAERTADPTDARAVLARITDAGRERLDRLRASRAAAVETRLAALDADERAALEAVLPVLDKLISEGAV